MQFGWDPAKNSKNIDKHEIDFEDVKPLFESAQPYLDREDDREDYGEERRIRMGWVQDLPLCVAYTLRGDVIWIISARLANPAEEDFLAAQIAGERKLQQAQWESEQSIELKKQEAKTWIESKREREER